MFIGARFCVFLRLTNYSGGVKSVKNSQNLPLFYVLPKLKVDFLVDCCSRMMINFRKFLVGFFRLKFKIFALKNVVF